MERMDLRVAAAIGLCATAFLFFGLGRYGVVNIDEAIYHGIAERMAETGELHHLDFRGEKRVYDTFMNAPLHYWARAGLIAAFGSNAFTMRALSALFGVLAVLATYALGCRLIGRSAALLAAAVQLTTFQFVYVHGARTGELDTVATALVAGCCLTFLRGMEEKRSFVPHHLLLATLLMTKVPLAILPLVAELAWLALHPEARAHVGRFVRSGLMLLPLALLWHGVQAVLEGERAAETFGTMLGQASGDRTATGRPAEGPGLGLAGHARFYAETVLYGAFPWAAAYPLAIAAALGRSVRSGGRGTALVFAAAVWGFFVLVSKTSSWYVMPVFPFLSILVGAWLHDLLREDTPPRAGLWLGFVIAACLWIGVDAIAANPFAKPAIAFPMQVEPRRLLSVGPWVGIPVAGVLWAGAWLAAAERMPAALRRGIAAACVAGLLAFACIRVAAPLAFLDFQSPLQQIRNKIDRAHAAGRPLDYPIPLGVSALGPPSVQIARFLFAEDFEIVIQQAADGTTDLVLYRKGDPRVLDRSIGRAGLEWQRARQQRGPERLPHPAGSARRPQLHQGK